DLRERLAVLQLRAELALGEVEVRRRVVEARAEQHVTAGPVTEAEPEPAPAAEAEAEQRVVARLDAPLQRAALLLREPARLHRGGGRVWDRLLERVRERVRLPSELARRVLDDRLTALVGRQELRGCERAARSDARERSDTGRRELPVANAHTSHSSTRP